MIYGVSERTFVIRTNQTHAALTEEEEEEQEEEEEEEEEELCTRPAQATTA